MANTDFSAFSAMAGERCLPRLRPLLLVVPDSIRFVALCEDTYRATPVFNKVNKRTNVLQNIHIHEHFEEDRNVTGRTGAPYGLPITRDCCYVGNREQEAWERHSAELKEVSALKAGERDYMDPVRRKWIVDRTGGEDRLGLLARKIGILEAAKCWDRISYAARTAAGITRYAGTATEERQAEARRIAEAVCRELCAEKDSVEPAGETLRMTGAVWEDDEYGDFFNEDLQGKLRLLKRRGVPSFAGWEAALEAWLPKDAEDATFRIIQNAYTRLNDFGKGYLAGTAREMLKQVEYWHDTAKKKKAR